MIGNSHEPDGYNFFQAGYGAHPDVQLIHFGTLNRCKNMRRTETGWQTDTESCVARADGLNNAEFVESLDVIVHSSKHPFGANKQIFLDILLDVKARNRDVKIVTLGGYIYTHIECARLINEGRGSEACRAPDQVAYFADQEDTEALFEQSAIGEMGGALSGGQRQRILLARALYRKPRILFLDEGTANLDEETEIALADFLKKLTITKIVVAHRPALLKIADSIYEVKDGKITPANYNSVTPERITPMHQ